MQWRPSTVISLTHSHGVHSHTHTSTRTHKHTAGEPSNPSYTATGMSLAHRWSVTGQKPLFFWLIGFHVVRPTSVFNWTVNSYDVFLILGDRRCGVKEESEPSSSDSEEKRKQKRRHKWKTEWFSPPMLSFVYCLFCTNPQPEFGSPILPSFHLSPVDPQGSSHASLQVSESIPVNFRSPRAEQHWN